MFGVGWRARRARATREADTCVCTRADLTAGLICKYVRGMIYQSISSPLTVLATEYNFSLIQTRNRDASAPFPSTLHTSSTPPTPPMAPSAPVNAATASPAVRAFLQQNFDPDNNAIRIGTCPCDNPALAKIDDLPKQIQVGCKDDKHLWSKVKLADTLAYLDADQPHKKTTKTMLLNNILSWQTYKDADVNAEGTDLLKYKPEMLKEMLGVDAADDDDDVEEVLRPEVMAPYGTVSSGRVLRSRTIVDSGVVVERPNMEASRTNVNRGMVVAYLHMIRDVSARCGPELLARVPLLLAAWKLQDAEFLPTVVSAMLLSYFVKIPDWLTAPTMLVFKESFDYVGIKVLVEQVNYTFGMTAAQAATILPPDVTANRLAREQLLEQVKKCIMPK